MTPVPVRIRDAAGTALAQIIIVTVFVVHREFMLLPAFGDNGHRLFARGFDIWAPLVRDFLAQQDFHR